jgi:hypothetical protein
MSPALARAKQETRARLVGLSKPKLRKPRSCDGCGDIYSRRNRVEAWTVQNQGSRIGWSKTILNLCVKKCSPAEHARRLVTVAGHGVR